MEPTEREGDPEACRYLHLKFPFEESFKFVGFLLEVKFVSSELPKEQLTVVKNCLVDAICFMAKATLDNCELGEFLSMI